MSSYKVILLGSAKTGKTTFLTRNRDLLATNIHDKAYRSTPYHPTTKSATSHLTFKSNRGELKFTIADTVGGALHPQDVNAIEALYITDAVMVFFDLTDLTSFIQAVSYCTAVKTIRPTTPVVLVANHINAPKVPGQLYIKEREVMDETIEKQLTVWREQLINVSYYNASTKPTGRKITDAFRHVAREVKGDESLTLRHEDVISGKKAKAWLASASSASPASSASSSD